MKIKRWFVSDTRTNVDFFLCIPEKKTTSSIYMLLPRSGKMTTVWNWEPLIRTLWFLLLHFFSFIKIVSLVYDSWIVIARENINVNGEQTVFFPLYMNCCSDQHSSHCERRSFQSMPLSPPPPRKKIRTRQNLNHTRCTCISVGLFMPLVYIISLPSSLFVLENLITVDKKEVYYYHYCFFSCRVRLC